MVVLKMNNIYFIGMCISMVIYIIIGVLVSKRIKGIDDYYVAGRHAPTFLISGSLIASYVGVALFMGDAAESYGGLFSPIVFLAIMQTAGYIIGAVFFGRYLRRSGVMTIPEFFHKRFVSKPMKVLSATTAIITMSVYLISIVQGIGTLMSTVTGVDYKICVILSLVVFTFITVLSGSNGVLITDTLMASVFTLAMILAALFISHKTGGWFNSIAILSSNGETNSLLSWSGKLGVLYNTGVENITWAFIYGIVWMSVCMVGPWQCSRYLMAKDENTVVKSAVPAVIGIALIEFLACIAAVFVNIKNPEIADTSKVMIWASMNIMPKVLGVILMTGILAAGISSATTFLSLVGSSVANDVLTKSKMNKITIGRLTMIIVSAIVLCLTLTNPPQIFWIAYLGGSIVSASWMPVALASILSKRLTKTGAFCGMLVGFVSCFSLKLYSNLRGITLPVYLEPSFVGMICNCLAMTVGTLCTKVTVEEKNARNELFIVPENERDPENMKKSLRAVKWMIIVGIGVTIFLLLLWVIPYLLNSR